jgi:hypothetical protein
VPHYLETRTHKQRPFFGFIKAREGHEPEKKKKKGERRKKPGDEREKQGAEHELKQKKKHRGQGEKYRRTERRLRNPEQKKIHIEKERKGERRSRRARTRVLYFISVPRVQANKKTEELPALISSAARLQLHHTKSVAAKETEGKFETGPLLSVAQSLRRSITVVFIVSSKPGKPVFPFVFICLILRGTLHCAKVN